MVAAVPVNRFDAEEILAGILRWVEIESPSYDASAVNRVMDVAAADARALGAGIERIPGRDGFGDVVLARWPGESDEPGLLILGHLDTVHLVGSIDGPLKVRREGDKVFGPGILDMKGGMHMAMHVLGRLMRARGRPYRLPITMMFIPDEEVGSPTSRTLIEAEAKRHAAVLVPEPGRGGRIVTGRHAFLRYTLAVRGTPAHAGADNRKGASAISAMALLIGQIEGWSDHARGKSFAVGTIKGGTFVNVVPMECEAQVLCVAPTAEDVADVQARMASLASPLPGAALEVRPGPVRPLFADNAGTAALWKEASAIADDIGLKVVAGQYGGGSDGNFTGALGVPTLDGLGVDGEGLHTHGEYILVSSLEPRARLFAGMIEKLAG